MKIRKVLYADKGMVLTNGETYGTMIFLGDDDNENAYHEISEEVYERIQAEQAAQSDA